MPKTEDMEEIKNNSLEEQAESVKENETSEEIVEQKDEKKEVKTKKEDSEKKESKKIENVSLQETVIEKIKTFLTKIAEMQREATEEIEGKDDESEETSEEAKPKFILEYYDLPYRYNETIVRVLAQTPQKLFVYWDISDNDRRKYEETFGDDFYNNTYPVLLLYNQDKQYVREIEVNDFANSWYIDIDDPKTKYIIQLGRKFRTNTFNVDFDKINEHNIILRNDYLPYAESNMMEAPNDHVLMEQLPEFITFRNVKTGEEMSVNIRGIKSLFGDDYDIKAFYDKNYKDELDDDRFDMSNPSSGGLRGLSSSSFK